MLTVSFPVEQLLTEPIKVTGAPAETVIVWPETVPELRLAEIPTHGVGAAKATAASERTIAAATAATDFVENFDMIFIFPFPVVRNFRCAFKAQVLIAELFDSLFKTSLSFLTAWGRNTWIPIYEFLSLRLYYFFPIELSVVRTTKCSRLSLTRS